MQKLTTASLALTIAATALLAGTAAVVAQDEPLKIGVVTDVGTVDDKNFNEYTFVGANAGAEAIGTETPVPVTVPNDPSDFPVLIQSYIDEGFDIIVTAGFNLGAETAKAAAANPDVWFVGVDQASESPNYVALQYQEDQAGYLAGIVSASASQTGTMGAIGGITLCGPCIRYIQGFELGAKSVNPDINVVTTYITDADFTLAFNDPVAGKQFGEDFLTANPDVDILFQVAGKTGNGMLEAVCERGILGVGVDVDQALSVPATADCTLTSATKSLALSVEETIKAIAAGTAKGGNDLWDASRDGVGIANNPALADRIPEGTQELVDTAFAAMAAGELTTCPENCGKLE
jgi:basic membrane lipoprotein Med (substrate-binding protein (PBP1-ABC) superfamily)